MRQSTDWHQRATWGMTLGLAAALCLLLTLRPGPFENVASLLEFDTLDFWFSLRDPRPMENVAVVAIDQDTLRRWHGNAYSAGDIAHLLVELKAAGARVVALALPSLADPDLDMAGDQQLQAAIAQGPPVVLPIEPRRRDQDALGADRGSQNQNTSDALKFAERYSVGRADFPLATSGLPASSGSEILAVPSVALMENSKGVGHLEFNFDRYGRARQLPLFIRFHDRYYPALPLAAAAAANVSVVDQSRPYLLNYPYSLLEPDQPYESPFPVISAAAALDDPGLLDLVRGRAVIIGVTAPGLASRYPAPTGQRITLAELDAVALDNILSGQPLQPAPEYWHWLLTMLPAMITGGFAAARRPAWSALVALLCVITVGLTSLGLFWQDIWLDTSVPWLTIGLTFLIGVIGRARRQERESTHVESTIEALTKVSDLIAAQTQQWDLLDRVLNWATSVLGATGASALLLDEKTGMLTFSAALGPRSDRLIGLQMRLGEGIAGSVAQTCEPAIVNGARRDPRFDPRVDQTSGFETHSILCVPLRVRDRTLGVIEVVNKENGLPFTELDAELLMAVANQSAVALDNARLYDQLNKRVEQSQGALAVANRQLQADKNLLQTVLHSMTDGVVVTDAMGRIQLLNPAAAALLPELTGSSFGKSLATVLHDFPLASLPPTNAAWNEARDGATLLFRGDSDTPRHIEARAAPLRSGDGELVGVVAVFADVTQRLQIEQAKSDFVSFVAHEMRSPLTSISGFSAMLQRSESSVPGSTPMANTTRSRFLGLIHDESERLTRLINNLLDVARIEAGRGIELNREVVDLGDLAQEAIESQRSYSSRHQIVARLAGVPAVYADRDKVIQIVINLISNALKYSPGGIVTVSATVDGDFVVLSVKDQGPGIPAEQRALLFERFGRAPAVARGAGARAKPTGTGLGLFLTKHMVEAHGGRIWVESEPGEGANFRFSLPAVRD